MNRTVVVLAALLVYMASFPAGISSSSAWTSLFNGKDLAGWKNNDLEASAHGNHIVTQVNGVKIVDFTDSAQKFSEGVIGLQIHTGGGVKMRWKEIYIREE